MLEKNIDNRLIDICQIKNHKWFQEIDFQQLELKKIKPQIIPKINNEEDL